MPRPYIIIRDDYENPVQMIRHDDKRIQIDILNMLWDCLPTLINDAANF
jgi:hypothetical protein